MGIRGNKSQKTPLSLPFLPLFFLPSHTHTHTHTHTNKTAKKKVIKRERKKKSERQGSYPEYKQHLKQCLSQGSDPASFFLTTPRVLFIYALGCCDLHMAVSNADLSTVLQNRTQQTFPVKGLRQKYFRLWCHLASAL